MPTDHIPQCRIHMALVRLRGGDCTANPASTTTKIPGGGKWQLMEGIVRKTAEESQELIPAPGSCLRIWGRPAHCLFLREEMALVTVCFPVACLTSSGERKKKKATWNKKFFSTCCSCMGVLLGPCSGYFSLLFCHLLSVEWA